MSADDDSNSNLTYWCNVLRAGSLEQPAPETAGSEDIKPIGQIQI